MVHIQVQTAVKHLKALKSQLSINSLFLKLCFCLLKYLNYLSTIVLLMKKIDLSPLVLRFIHLLPFSISSTLSWHDGLGYFTHGMMVRNSYCLWQPVLLLLKNFSFVCLIYILSLTTLKVAKKDTIKMSSKHY